MACPPATGPRPVLIMQRAALRHVLSDSSADRSALSKWATGDSRGDVACDVGGQAVSVGDLSVATLRSCVKGLTRYEKYPYRSALSLAPECLRPPGDWSGCAWPRLVVALRVFLKGGADDAGPCLLRVLSNHGVEQLSMHLRKTHQNCVVGSAFIALCVIAIAADRSRAIYRPDGWSFRT